MILNEKQYPCLHDDGSIEYQYKPMAYRFKNLKDFDYWYIEIHYTWRPGTNRIKNFEDFVPDYILAQLKNSITKLLIFSVEPITTVVEDIYRFMQKFNVPYYNIILMCELVDINDFVTSVNKKYDLGEISTYYAPTGELNISSDLKRCYKKFDNLITLEKKKYDKSFINLNRRWRLHRPLFVSLLYCHNLLNAGYVSLGDTGDKISDWTIVIDKLISIVDDNTAQLLSSRRNELINLPKLYVDTTDLTDNITRIDAFKNTISFYKDSYFSIVSETCFFENVGRYLTEKPFKPIALKHPFLIIGPVNTLDAMKKLGYKTFHPYINESYDSEPNQMQRLKMILEETKRLSTLSEYELSNWIDKVKPIVEQNYQTLRTKDYRKFDINKVVP